MSDEPIPRLTARQWRAERRKHAARQRAFRRENPELARREDEWLRMVLWIRGVIRREVNDAWGREVRRRLVGDNPDGSNLRGIFDMPGVEEVA